jgi:hypothetical protein
MKKIFTTALALFVIKGALVAQTCTAVPMITLTGAPSTPMMIAFNPIKNLYYASSGGGPCNNMATYTTTGGAPLNLTSVCYDSRGLWWNTNTNTLEGNSYNSAGIYTVTLNGVTGYPTGGPGGGANFPANNLQPSDQHGGQYDPTTNQVIYRNNLTIVKYNRTTSALVSTTPITGLPAGFGSLSVYGFYIGTPGAEYAIYDYTNKRAYLINYTTGAYVSTVQFPLTAGNANFYELSYSNGMFWIHNGSVWIGYKAGISAFSSPTSLCSGNSATLTASGATTYTWNPGALTGSNVVVTPTASTVYSITSNAVGCSAATLTLTVNQTPTVTVNSGAACSGNSFTMTPSGASTYTFSSGSAVVTPTANTSYSVTGTSSLGCISNVAISSVSLGVTPTITVNSGAVCAGNSFTMSPSGASTYTFSSGNAVVTPTANTSYSVTGTSSTGCVSSNAAVSSVSVNALPTVSVNSGAVCAGSTFTMVPTGANTYTFSSGNAVVTPTANSSYSVTGTNSLGCVSSNAAISTVSVNAAPAVTAVSNTTLICSGSSATLTASGAISYTWNTTATTTAVVISPSVTTSYTVTGSGANGCKNTITITQSVSACAGINANQLSNTIISVYPNPSNGEFTISTDSDMNLSIINNLGQVVKEISINSSNNYNASVSNLANGIYFVVGKNNDQLISQKIIVAN